MRASGERPRACSIEAGRSYSGYLSAMGRHDEAIAAMGRGLERDPASSAGRFGLARAYYLAKETVPAPAAVPSGPPFEKGG